MHRNLAFGRIVMQCPRPRRLSLDKDDELDGGGAHVGSFILRSAQQEEALHRIWCARAPIGPSARAPARGYSRLSFRPA
ncbi:unnamed protein product [Spirodela intermedia]|uniref:Uncharacterized protein n=1 Tax=Spirodela intermedia TaxID=51605 RepID=A0A7I8IH27_SPIIN|nr:unnamed protein product [Spirodela intermedia]CAA6657092.1 unnamed protein product [Spirodela intermedia]